MTRLFSMLGFAACAAVLGACSATTSSQHIRTAGMVAQVDVTSEGNGQSVVASRMVVGGGNSNTRIILEGGDQLFAEVDGERQQMAAVGRGRYEARFSKAEGEFVVGLERDGDDAALETRGTLPPPFEITSDLADNPLSRESDPITLTWEPSGGDGEVEIVLNGDCILRSRHSVAGNPGTYTIPAGELRAWKSKADQSCNVTARISVMTLGNADPSLASDSRVRLYQVREARFVSAP